MSHLDPFGLKVSGVMRVRFAPNWHLLDHLNPITLKPYHLLWIIRQETKLADPEIIENLRADAIIAQVAGEPESGVRFHGIETFLLQLICVNFCREPDPAAFLPHVNQHA